MESAKDASSQSSTTAHDPRRLFPLLGVIVATVAFVGFIEGIADRRPYQPEIQAHPAEHALSRGRAAAALPYRDMASAKIGPNVGWQSRLHDLKFDRPGLFDRVEQTEAMKLAALADRARTRAFEGAPPVIPHQVDQQSAASCLACHGEGAKIGDRVATKMSHTAFTSCTQCHVEAVAAGPFEERAAVSTAFVGLYRSGPGNRALALGPPTIPHRTSLREDCLSCHGLIARPGLRTTHPWLSQCVQCHAASAELDEHDFPLSAVESH
jgi:cytochrome c-type protein NapB